MSTQTPPFSPAPPRPRRRHPLLWSFVVLLAIAIVGCVVGTVALFSNTTEKNTRKEFSSGMSRLRVQTGTGHITVRAGAEGEAASVETRTRSAFADPKVTTTERNGVLEVEGTCSGSHFLLNVCSVDFDVIVPAGVVVEATTDTGDVTLDGMTSGGDLTTDTGSIEITDGGGEFGLRTDTGKITGVRLDSSRVTAESDTGGIDLSFTGTPDAVDASTDTGNVVVTVPGDDSYRVEATTDTGRRTVEVPDESGAVRTIRLRADTGNVEVLAN